MTTEKLTPAEGDAPSTAEEPTQAVEQLQKQLRERDTELATMQKNYKAMQRNVGRFRDTVAGGTDTQVAALQETLAALVDGMVAGGNLDEAAQKRLQQASSKAALTRLEHQFRQSQADEIESIMQQAELDADWQTADGFKDARTAWSAGKYGDAVRLTRQAAITAIRKSPTAEAAKGVKESETPPQPQSEPPASKTPPPDSRPASSGAKVHITSQNVQAVVEVESKKEGWDDWYRQHRQEIKEAMYGKQ